MNDMKWTPANVISLVIIVGCLILKGLGVDSVVDTILVGAASFYFGLYLPTPKE